MKASQDPGRAFRVVRGVGVGVGLGWEREERFVGRGLLRDGFIQCDVHLFRASSNRLPFSGSIRSASSDNGRYGAEVRRVPPAPC